MIKNYLHKGVELYVLKGDKLKLKQSYIIKIRLDLTRLDSAKSPEQMNGRDIIFTLLKVIYRVFIS